MPSNQLLQWFLSTAAAAELCVRQQVLAWSLPSEEVRAFATILAQCFTWRQTEVRRFLLIGLSAYIIMRVWSGLYFIREMLAFQQVPLDSCRPQLLYLRAIALSARSKPYDASSTTTGHLTSEW